MRLIDESPCNNGAEQRNGASDQKAFRGAQDIPNNATDQASYGASRAEAHAAVERLPAPLVSTSEIVMHQVNRRRVKGTEGRRMHQLR